MKSMESRAMADDRAVVVARAILTVFAAPELRQQIEDILRKAAAMRDLPPRRPMTERLVAR
jgi:hypothetical protein